MVVLSYHSTGTDHYVNWLDILWDRCPTDKNITNLGNRASDRQFASYVFGRTYRGLTCFECWVKYLRFWWGIRYVHIGHLYAAHCTVRRCLGVARTCVVVGNFWGEGMTRCAAGACC